MPERSYWREVRTLDKQLYETGTHVTRSEDLASYTVNVRHAWELGNASLLRWMGTRVIARTLGIKQIGQAVLTTIETTPGQGDLSAICTFTCYNYLVSCIQPAWLQKRVLVVQDDAAWEQLEPSFEEAWHLQHHMGLTKPADEDYDSFLAQLRHAATGDYPERAEVEG